MTRCPTLALSKILALHFGHTLIKRSMMLTSLLGKFAASSEAYASQGGFCLQNSSHRNIRISKAGLEVPDQLLGVYPETMSLDVILKSNGTKNLMVSPAAEILRGIYPFGKLRAGSELAEGLRMTLGSFLMALINQFHL